MQPRLERRTRRRAICCLASRFRAAYDFCYLRESAAKKRWAVVAWWTRYQGSGRRIRRRKMIANRGGRKGSGQAVAQPAQAQTQD